MPQDPPFTKTATTTNGRARLRREAEVLRRVAHPGVVSLVALTEFDDRTELATARVAGTPLATAPTPSPAQAVTQAASVARTVADLHEVGIAHRRLTPDHVLVNTDGRPVLCGLADAGAGDPDADIRKLGTIFELLAESAAAPANGRESRLQRGLLALAEQARTAPNPPSAAVLAQLAGALEGRRRPAALPPLRLDRRKVAAIAAGVVGLGAGIAALVSVQTSDAAAPPLTTLPRTEATPAASTAPSPATPRSASSDGGAEAERSTSGGVEVEAGGARYAVGQAGDHVVLGDWDCDGQPGAALLRPATGAVFVFDVLATPDQPISGRPLATVPDAVGLVTIDQTDGCTSLAVRLADGSPRVLLARGGAR